MHYTIYQITCKSTGKIYIGKHQTKDLDDGYMGSGKLLGYAKNKHGLENFTKEILHVFPTEEEMNRKESELVTEEFCLREDTFNLCPGGKGGWGYVNSSGHRNGFETTLNDLDFKSTIVEAGNRGGLATKNKWEIDADWSNSERKKISARTKKQIDSFGNPFKNKTHTLEWRKEQSTRMKEKSKGLGNSQFGTMWITNGIETKKIKKTESIPEGFIRGRSL
jgi:hypothetical protein